MGDRVEPGRPRRSTSFRAQRGKRVEPRSASARRHALDGRQLRGWNRVASRRLRNAGRAVMVLALAAFVVSPLSGGPRTVQAAGPCGPPVTSVIACENSLPGTPQSVWDSGVGSDLTIVGFSTDISVNLGGTIAFKIKTPASAYTIDIYRIGYYQGNGARHIASVTPSAKLPQTQPACLTDATTGLTDCGNWGVSASWAVPSTAVSGVYEALLKRTDTGGRNQIMFVVRNDASRSDLLFQTSDTTWQAYNAYGGNSLYVGNPGPASKVSYNRPFTTRESLNATWDTSVDFFFYGEYPAVRFLEQNGYDVSYFTGVDADRSGGLIKNHKTYLSVGHDEYWSGGQRTNVEAARDSGVNLVFMSGNEVFWKTRWEPSVDGTATAYRTLVTYKETHASAVIDPKDPPTWTGTWRDPRFSPPADGGRPENALTGQYMTVNAGTATIKVPSTYSKLRFWRNTPVAKLTSGQTATLGLNTLGYEWDVDADNGFRPPGLADMSSTTVAADQVFNDYGTNVAAATQTHHLTLYRAPSGALVFGAGTIQWSWGLDNTHDGSGASDPSIQQSTINVLADMGAQPATLMNGMVAATQSTDTTPPSSTITSPSAASSFASGATVNVSGTASDVGGMVAGVEVSIDGGTSWHPATGTTSWTYSAAIHGMGNVVIRSRAVDDSGNLEAASAGVTVSVNCPCSIWGNSYTPGAVNSGDTHSTEVGVKFRSDTFGTITGIRFYKSAQNTGTHIGNLWTSTGTNLGSATFTGETASGWQQVTFSSPVAIQANTTYIASYFAPAGHFSVDDTYLYANPAPAPVGGGTQDSAPLHALRNGVDGPNGVFTYAGSSTFPATDGGAATNYWVDPVFASGTVPGVPTGVTATAGYGSAQVSWTAPTSGPPTSYTVTPWQGSTALTPTAITGSPAPTSTVIPGLTNGTAYTFTVTASNPLGTSAASAHSGAVTPSASGLLVYNGGFESGMTPWLAGGIKPGVLSTAKVHTGTTSVLLGTPTAPEPNGDSWVQQTVSVPVGTSTLSFWYTGGTNGDVITSDWQEAQIRNTSGTTLAEVFKALNASTAWTQVTYDLSPFAGQTIVLWFNVHEDGSATSDQSWMYIDDVAIAFAGPPVAPAAPTGVTAAAGNGSATVSWTAPSNGGSPISSYTVTPFIGSAAQTVVTVTGSPPVTTATVQQLTNGTAYTFTVSATNAVGTGPASTASNAVTPSAPTVPAAPTGVTATGGNAAATVSWTAPANGGSAITSYTVTPFIGSAAQPTLTVAGTPPATTTTVLGLSNGTTYTFTVSATNAVGTGPASAVSNAVTPVAAVAPTFVQKASAHGTKVASLTVTPTSTLTSGNRLVVEVGVWSQTNATVSTVTDSSGDVFTELNHFLASDATEMSVWTAPVTAGGGVKPTLTVKPTVAADVGVALVEYAGLSTAAGTGAVDQQAQATGTAATAAAGPTAATTAGNELAVGMYADSGWGTTLAADAGYASRVNVSPAGDMEFVVEDAVVASSGTTPRATVQTASGDIWLMDVVVFKPGTAPPPTVPGAPTGVTATAGNTSATVSWTAPSNGGSAITSYTVTPYVGSAAQTTVTVAGSPPATTTTVLGLTNGTTYTFTVTATNAVGTGPASTASNAVTPSGTAPGGQWGSLTTWPIVAVHAVLMSNGKVLAWDGWQQPQPTQVWDPATQKFGSTVNAPDSIFCSGTVQLPDGRVLVIGGYGGLSTGQIGIVDTNIFNPATNTWTRVADMHTPRWYPDLTELADGRYVAISGASTTATTFADTPEVYDPTANTWTALTGVSTSQVHEEEYPFSFLAPNSKVFTIGPEEDVSYFLDANAKTWTSVGASGSFNGSAVMYRPGKILYSGGASSITTVTPAQSSARMIDLTAVTPSWQPTSSMASARVYHTLTMLADGKVLAVGGEATSNQTNATTGVLSTEIWDPTTGVWTTGASMSAARNYHSTAILMPDGTVLVAGGGHEEGSTDPGQFSSQVYSPPYLFAGPRPTITTAPSSTTYGSNMSITTPDASSIASVNLVSLGAETHQSDMSQHFVPLSFTAGSGTLTVQAPASGALAPPGNYMVFIVNSAGVPSVASIVNVGTSTTATAPAAPTGVTAAAGNGSATVSWTAPANGGSPISSYTVTPYIGSTAQTAVTVTGSPPVTTTTVPGLTNGTAYTFTVSASNAVGTGPASAASNAVTPSAPTVPAAPTGVTAAAGNGSATVSWTAPANGGSAITSYAVTPFVGTTAQSPVTVAGTPPATTTTVLGLTNGTTYTFTVSAANAVGAGPASGASNAVTPANIVTPTFVQKASAHAAKVASLAVTPTSALTSGNRLVVEVGVWSQTSAKVSTVIDSSGDVFTELTHFVASDATEMSVWTAPVTAGGGVKPTLTVKPTVAADVGVALVEYAGLSTAAGTGAVDQQAQATGTAATAAAGPTAATTAGNELAVGMYVDSGWGTSLVADPGYTPRVNVSPAGDMEFVVEDGLVAASGSTPRATVQTASGDVWLMTAVVFKSSGTAPPPTAPGAPTGVSAIGGNASATVSWTAPGNGGSPITSYTVTPFVGTTAQTAVTVAGSPPATTTTMSGLTNETAYTFTVSATNAVGTGPASGASNAVTPSATAPTAPAIDPSTPAIATFSNNVSSATTAPFSPPATSVIYMAVSLDSVPGVVSSVAAVTNTGTALNWHFKGNENHTNSSIGGYVEVWWAYNATQQTSITVSATLAQPTKNVPPPTGGLQVLVFDHAAADQTSAAWTPTWDVSGGSLATGTITTTAQNSLVFAVVDNWDSSVQPTLPSDQTTTINGQVAAVLNPTDQDTYWVQVKTAPTAQPGSVTMSVLAPNVRYHMITWEVLGAVGG
jgi:hypothetical protein